MFERFTTNARRIVVRAQAQAKRLRHDTIDTDHVLMGLALEVQSTGGRCLAGHGLGVEAMERVSVALRPSGDAEPKGHVPFTGGAKKALENSLREALDLKRNYIGTEHLLLGLLHDRGCTAVRILAALGADPDALRRTALDASETNTPSRDGENVLVHLGDTVRAAVGLARSEAVAHRHAEIGTEHLLLGLLHTGQDRDDAVRLLLEHGVTLPLVLRRVDELVGRGRAEAPAEGRGLPFTPHAGYAMTLSQRERLTRAQHEVTAAHVLTGILRVPESTGARILAETGLDADTARQRLFGAAPEPTGP